MAARAARRAGALCARHAAAVERRAASQAACSPPTSRRGLAACAAAPPDAGGDLLLRDFLFDRLYHPTHGYFTAQQHVVGALPAPLPFASFLNRAEYVAAVHAAYAAADVAWFTPVELFRPWYARALARHILGAHDAAAGAPLRVYELGGGTGAAARGVLDALAELAPDVYRTMRYVAVEVSAELGRRQAAAVADVAGHAARFAVERRDAADVAGWGGRDEAPCFVIALEVLDNLPHDRVVRVKTGAGATWHETRVRGVLPPPPLPPPPPPPPPRKGGAAGRAQAAAAAAAATAAASQAPPAGPPEQLSEVLSPLSDPLIARCLAICEAHEAQRGPLQRAAASARRALAALAGRGSDSAVDADADDVAFLPTTCLKLLDALATARPRHRLIFADFDHLPGVRVRGVRAPLVASQRGGGSTSDHDSYLLPRGAADVFFPTDFALLGALAAEARRAAGAPAAEAPRVLRTADFLTHALSPGREWRRAAAASGFNPLLVEFPNTRVFLG